VQTALTTGGSWTFTCSGTIFVPTVGATSTPFAVAAGRHVSLDATGQTVTLDGSDAASVLTVAKTATVTITGLTIYDGLAAGANAPHGTSGGTGSTGTKGQGGTLPVPAGATVAAAPTARPGRPANPVGEAASSTSARSRWTT
jgi:hypothetical protein